MSDLISNSKETNIVVDALVATLNGQGDTVPEDINNSTQLFGANGLLDSIGLVALVIEIESQIAAKLDVAIVLADDRAMSQRNSPFRSVESLAAHVVSLVNKS